MNINKLKYFFDYLFQSNNLANFELDCKNIVDLRALKDYLTFNLKIPYPPLPFTKNIKTDIFDVCDCLSNIKENIKIKWIDKKICLYLEFDNLSDLTIFLLKQ